MPPRQDFPNCRGGEPAISLSKAAQTLAAGEGLTPRETRDLYSRQVRRAPGSRGHRVARSNETLLSGVIAHTSCSAVVKGAKPTAPTPTTLSGRGRRVRNSTSLQEIEKLLADTGNARRLDRRRRVPARSRGDRFAVPQRVDRVGHRRDDRRASGMVFFGSVDRIINIATKLFQGFARRWSLAFATLKHDLVLSSQRPHDGGHYGRDRQNS